VSLDVLGRLGREEREEQGMGTYASEVEELEARLEVAREVYVRMHDEIKALRAEVAELTEELAEAA